VIPLTPKEAQRLLEISGVPLPAVICCGSRRSKERVNPVEFCVMAANGWSAGDHIEMIDGTAIAIIRRFDRTPDAARLAYLSGGSLLQARRTEDRAYTEIADALRRIGASLTEDVLELWRRMLFNFLITNVDDHLWNVGVLYAGNGQWRLAPAFDVNPFPDRARESKTWLSEEMGPITSLRQLIDGCAYFGLQRERAEQDAATMATALADGTPSPHQETSD
jgi:serine/threonine-protein kinase HipA